MERAYDDAKYGRVSAAPALEVVIPTFIDPSLAPAGKHVISDRWPSIAPYKLRDTTPDQARQQILERGR